MDRVLLDGELRRRKNRKYQNKKKYGRVLFSLDKITLARFLPLSVRNIYIYIYENRTPKQKTMMKKKQDLTLKGRDLNIK